MYNFNFAGNNFINQSYATSTTTTTWTWTSNTTYTANQWIINPYVSYEISESPFYTDDLTGLQTYLIDKKIYLNISFVLEDLYEQTEDLQEFEDSLFGVVLDCLYEELSHENKYTFDILDEKKYSFEEIESIVQKAIKVFHERITEEL